MLSAYTSGWIPCRITSSSHARSRSSISRAPTHHTSGGNQLKRNTAEPAHHITRRSINSIAATPGAVVVANDTRPERDCADGENRWLTASITNATGEGEMGTDERRGNNFPSAKRAANG